MKKTLLLSFFCCIASLCSAQLTSHFNTFETKKCLSDSSKSIKVASKWLAYQTTDGNWYGPIDSSRCITMIDTSYFGSHKAKIALNQVNPNEPLYVRYQFDGTYPLLFDDSLLTVAAYANYSTGLPIQTTTNCNGDICTGVQVAIEIPDSNGTGKAVRMHNFPSYVKTSFTIEACMPTEYFKENRLKEYIFKFTFQKNADLQKHWILLKDAGLDEDKYANISVVKKILVEKIYATGNNTYNLPFWRSIPSLTFWQDKATFFLKYNPTNGYPSQAHPTYLDVLLEANTATVQTINLNLWSESQLITQPFTFLRGQLVIGSDSIRHIVNLTNNGATICLGGFEDMPFNHHTNYIHESGYIELETAKSCILFRDSAMLKVVENSTLRYGDNGLGMLALQSGAKIVLEKGATLHLNNTLMLKEMNDKGFTAPVSVDLQQGAHLEFGEAASINALQSGNRLYVYMNGGTLDDSRLSAVSQALIQRIYPSPNVDFSTNVQVSPNPTEGDCTIHYLAAEAENITLTLHDSQGNLLQQQAVSVQKGWNRLLYRIENEVTGCCFLTLKSNTQQTVKKVMVLR